MKKLGAGIYDDGQGAIHIDASELLEHLGWEDTPANVARVIATASKVVEEKGWQVPVEVVQDDVAYSMRRQVGA